jgi:multidrug efflux pump subunit AcrA (membrane-fusion protein)
LKRLTRSLLFASLAAAVTVGAGLAWRAGHPATLDLPAEAVVRVTRGPLEVAVRETGRIEAYSQVDLRSKVAGQVLRVLVEEGDAVKAGQVLLELDATDLRRQLAQAEADVAIARAQLRAVTAGAGQAQIAEARAHVREAQAHHAHATQALARVRRAEQVQGASARELEEARAEREAAAANVEAATRRLAVIAARLGPEEDQARAQLHKAELAERAAREQLQRAVLHSPVSGTVVHRGVEVGEMVTPGVAETASRKPLLTVADLSRLLVAVDLNQIDVARLRPGLPATVRVDALPGRRFSGRLHRIAPAAVPGAERDVRLFPVEVLLVGKEAEGLRPGMSADVDITVERRDAVLQLPVQAVRRDRDNGGQVTLVRREGASSRTEHRDVKLGVHSDHHVELSAGLVEGDEVVIDPPAAGGNVNRF